MAKQLDNEQTPKTQWNTSQLQSEESHEIHVREASDLPKDSEEVPSGTQVCEK